MFGSSIFKNYFIFKNIKRGLGGVTSWLENCPVDKRVAGSIPDQNVALSHQCFYLLNQWKKYPRVRI